MRIRQILQVLPATTAFCCGTLFSGVAVAAASENMPAYKNAALPVEQRVADLLGRMTLEEKVQQMRGLWQIEKQITTKDGVFVPAKAQKELGRGMGEIGPIRWETVKEVTLRNAIQKFNSDMGDWPADLEQLVLPKTDPPSGNGGSGVALDSANYQGPYLRNPDQGLPEDPFTKASDWNYTATTGEVHSASTGSALDGTAYSAW